MSPLNPLYVSTGYDGPRLSATSPPWISSQRMVWVSLFESYASTRPLLVKCHMRAR